MFGIIKTEQMFYKEGKGSFIMKAKYVIVNKFRFYFIICTFSLLIIVISSIFIGTEKISSESIQSNTVYVVKDGDRLWDIAALVDSNEDIRQVVRNIRLNNNIASNEYIYPGQKLIIPYQINTQL